MNRGHKRRKTDESVINDSVASSDPLNEAIQDYSSCVDDDWVIESTPKPDVTRKNVTKSASPFKSPLKRNQVKVEKVDDSKIQSLSDVQKPVEVKKCPDSPLRSVENQGVPGKENRVKQHPTKWISNAMTSPSRTNRSGFISVKSPKGVSRLSLSKAFKQSRLEFTRKSTKKNADDVSGIEFSAFASVAWS